MKTIEIQTTAREQMLDITSKIQSFLDEEELQDGAILIFCSHTTCGLTINECADPDVRRDIMRFFGEIAPYAHNWQHVEGNTDAHIRSSLLGVSLLVPVEKGQLCLGRWQAIYLYEGDGPRRRSLWLRFLH